MAKQGSMFRLTITILIALIVILYTIFNTRLIIKGPSIQVFDLKSGQTIEEDLVEIKGMAKNISFISLNGRQIFIDKDYNFKEKVLLSNKINPIEIYARDKFGKETYQKLILLKEVEQSPLPGWGQPLDLEAEDNTLST